MKTARRKLSELITPARGRLGLSMHECSRRSGISAVYWHQIERDKNIPSPEVLKKVCRVLGLDYELAADICDHKKELREQRKFAAKDLVAWLFDEGMDLEDCMENFRERYG